MHTDPCGKEKAVANEWSSRVTMAIQRERRSGWYIGDCKRWKCYNSKRLGSVRGSGGRGIRCGCTGKNFEVSLEARIQGECALGGAFRGMLDPKDKTAWAG
jgi:hypothetical protein